MIKKHPDGTYGYYIRVRDAATGRRTKRLRIKGFKRRQDAEEAVEALRTAERNAIYGLAPVKRHKLSDLIANRLPDIVTPHERTRAARVLKQWLSLLPEGITVDQIETPDIKKYVDRRLADGQSTSSVAREINIISATLNSAPTYYRELRAYRPPKMPQLRVTRNRRERIITDDEYRNILAYLQRPRTRDETHLAFQARQRAALLLRFALITGMRPKEIFALRWEHIDWDGGRIKVVGTKTENRVNSTRYIPLGKDHRAILEARQITGESIEYVFSISGSPRYTDYDLFKEACEYHGIPYGRSVENGFELYCARHTFTTRLLMAGLSLREVGAITGHSDRELVLYYSHIAPESQARTLDKIEEIEARRLNPSID